MKIFCLIMVYLLVGFVNFFIFGWFMFLKENLGKDTFKNTLKSSFLDSCREIQKLDSNDSADVAMVVVLVVIWPIVLVHDIFSFICLMITFSIKHTAEQLGKKIDNPKSKDTKSPKKVNIE